MDQAEKRRIVEALVLAAQESIPAARIAGIVPRCKPAQVRALIDELNKSYIEQGRAFEICEVAGGYQMRTLPQFAPYLQQTLSQRPLRLSQAALETLSIVAYRQPVTRGEIEHIRGVDVGAVLRSLIERKLVRIAGHREVPGRPMLYGTTKRFLEVFELDKLEDLPTLRDLRELAPEDAPSGVPLRVALGDDADDATIAADGAGSATEEAARATDEAGGGSDEPGAAQDPLDASETPPVAVGPEQTPPRETKPASDAPAPIAPSAAE